MKKFLSVMAIVLLCIILAGCSQNNAQSRLAIQKLSSSVDKMIVTAKKADMIDETKIDLSGDLGYYIENDGENRGPLFSPKTTDGEKRTNLETPTPNRANNYAENQSSMANNRRFYFISKETEDNYGDLYYISDRCVTLISNVRESRDNLLNNCIKTKTLLQKVADNKVNMSEADLKTMNSYNEVISSSSDRLSHGVKCSDCVNNITNKKSNLLLNSGSMTADYLKLANDLDNNYTSLDNANLSISQLNNYLHKLLGEEIEDSPFMLRNRYNHEYRAPFSRPDNLLPPRYTEFMQNKDKEEQIDNSYAGEEINNQIKENNEAIPDDMNKIVHPPHEEDEQIFTDSDMNNQLNEEQKEKIYDQHIDNDINNAEDNQPEKMLPKDEINANKNIDEITEDIKNKHQEPSSDENLEKNEINRPNKEDDFAKLNNPHNKRDELERKRHLNEIYQKYVKPNKLHENQRKITPPRNMTLNPDGKDLEITKNEHGISYCGIKEVRA